MTPKVPFRPLTPSEVDLFATFKDSGGRYRTKSLFIEYKHPKYPAFFTLQRYNVTKDGKEYISMYKKYTEISDPTEFQVAMRLLGSWAHWLQLQQSMWFMVHLNQWRKELAVQLESRRFIEMTEVVNKRPGTGAAIAASKWLASRYGEKKETKPKRGRPSNDERDQHLREEAAEHSLLAEEAERLGLN